MDLLTASYTRQTAEGEELMVALIPANAPGITRSPFWQNSALAAAESIEVRLNEVFVPERMLFPPATNTCWATCKPSVSSGSSC